MNYKTLIVLETVIFVICTALIFIFIAVSRELYSFVVGFIIIMLIVAFWIFFSWQRLVEYIRHMTDEVASLPNEDKLIVKSIRHQPKELHGFFTELEQVRKQLERKNLMRHEVLDIANIVASNMDIEKMLHDLLPKLNNATHSICSAFYAVNHSANKLEIRHSVGFNKNIYNEFDLRLGEGFIGQPAIEKEIRLYNDLPDDTVYILRTFLGKIKPRGIMVVPVITQDKPAGVLVCASIYNYSQEDLDMIELIRHYLGVAVSNGMNYEKTKRMANEMAFQNKLIQEQYIDMKKKLDEKTKLLDSYTQSP